MQDGLLLLTLCHSSLHQTALLTRTAPSLLGAVLDSILEIWLGAIASLIALRAAGAQFCWWGVTNAARLSTISVELAGRLWRFAILTPQLPTLWANVVIPMLHSAKYTAYITCGCSDYARRLDALASFNARESIND